MGRGRRVLEADFVRIALCQLNATVGDLPGNFEKACGGYHDAVEQGADMVLFPELFLAGYPPEDLLFKRPFVRECEHYLRRFSKQVRTGTAIIGVPLRIDGSLYNAAAVVAGGRVASVYRKVFLPNYGVFDERRYFDSGETIPAYVTGALRWGVTVCEDLWMEKGPAACLAAASLWG